MTTIEDATSIALAESAREPSQRIAYHQPSRQSRKTIYTLNVDNYAPEITEITFRLIKEYAEKVGAEFHVITERKRPNWPVTIEKFQVAELAADRGDEWSMFIDADALVSPEFFDPTDHMTKDQVAHNGKDMAGIRWTADKYFRRDARWFGSCTWTVIASEWTVEDLWKLPTQTPEEVFGIIDERGVRRGNKIHVTIGEHMSGQCSTEHLIDDYTLSRNIARYGLRATTLVEICAGLGYRDPTGKGFNPWLWHKYTMATADKLREMLMVLSTPNGHLIPDPRNPQAPPIGVGWGIMDGDWARAHAKKWGL